MARKHQLERSAWRWAAAALICGLAFLCAIAARRAPQPPKPAFPSLQENYLQYVSRGATDHYLYLYGILGMRERIRDSDVLLFGSSHLEFGISAQLLSEALSRQAGRKVRVYNLGAAYADGARFAAEIIRANDLRDKGAVFELFTDQAGGVSDYARKVLQANALQAYAAVGEIWWAFLRDWTLDGILPRVVLEGWPKLGRFLHTPVAFRSRETGDISSYWYPTVGQVVPQPSTLKGLPLGKVSPFGPAVDGHAALPGTVADLVRERRIRAVMTIIPFDGYDAAAVERMATAQGFPFSAISPEGIETWDTHHLTPASRSVATSRLMQGLTTSGLLP
jgi:hypothetical protein